MTPEHLTSTDIKYSELQREYTVKSEKLQLTPKLQESGTFFFSQFINMHQSGKETSGTDADFKDPVSFGTTEGVASFICSCPT